MRPVTYHTEDADGVTHRLELNAKGTLRGFDRGKGRGLIILKNATHPDVIDYVTGAIGHEVVGTFNSDGTEFDGKYGWDGGQ